MQEMLLGSKTMEKRQSLIHEILFSKYLQNELEGSEKMKEIQRTDQQSHYWYWTQIVLYTTWYQQEAGSSTY